MVTFSIIATSLVSFIPSLLPVRQRVSNLPTSTGKRSKPMLSILEDGSPKKLSLTQIGSKCGPVLERHYAPFITPTDIDKLATAGVNILRIPTTYAAWIKVPGSNFYSGNQAQFFKNIASYAIAKHGIHIILDIHSLPGGVNGMGFGEGEGRFGWFNNVTNLDYSLRAVDAALAFIQSSGTPQSYTLEPINELVDNRDFTTFGTPAALTENGVA
ncbi:glycoside hydrolase [Alternaria burnsii]|uniref:glucan 1,3-beta-glucosidase n=1 Tax=Alternaria burnsii TaxID=1187904 RepID=A0A8H7B3Y1_9PLEO|nr:glycoside hydrolase [Alternaria burnsii]KAF7674870.1 glycoside hydrolase [Alternaria burnsii]